MVVTVFAVASKPVTPNQPARPSGGYLPTVSHLGRPVLVPFVEHRPSFRR